MTDELTAADTLRDQLKGLLSELDDEIRTSFPCSSSELSRKTDIAEVSVVQDVVGLVRRALLGELFSQDSRCSPVGQAADLRDALLVCARDLRLERERREADLSSLQSLTWPQRLSAAFQDLLDEEERVCEHVQTQSLFSRERAVALKTVISDLSSVCLGAIADAMRLPSADESERRRLAADANATAETVASQWLEWIAAWKRRQAKHWSACAPVRIPAVLTEASSQDKQTAAFLLAIRTAMRLRRQQIRLLAVQQRLTSVLAAGEVFSSLSRSIQFLP
jgi:hypothetical protein